MVYFLVGFVVGVVVTAGAAYYHFKATVDMEVKSAVDKARAELASKIAGK